jgi:hypothetical protein
VSVEEARERVRLAVCGIGNPEAFRQTVLDLGLRPEFRFYGNHETLPVEDLLQDRESLLLLTEKDAVRIDGPVNERILALRIALEDFSPAS